MTGGSNKISHKYTLTNTYKVLHGKRPEKKSIDRDYRDQRLETRDITFLEIFLGIKWTHYGGLSVSYLMPPRNNECWYSR